MAKTKLRLWECPNGKHPAVRAPARPRKDDVRRYCLKCSEGSGRLAERRCPSLERERNVQAAKVGEKRKAKLAREREAERSKYVLAVREADGSMGEVHIPNTLKRMLRLPALRDHARRHTSEPPTVNLRRSQQKPYTSGHAPEGCWEFTVTAANNPSREEFEEVLLHELVHLLLPAGEWHGSRFRRTLVRAAREWWPGKVTARPDEDGETWELDARIVRQASEGAARRSRDAA